MMNWGKWEKSKITKPCDGCSDHINKGDTYLLAKFSLPDEGTNVSRLFSMNLCVNCVSDFEHVTNQIKVEDDPI